DLAAGTYGDVRGVDVLVAAVFGCRRLRTGDEPELSGHRRDIARIINARMVDRNQRTDHRLADLRQFAQGEVAFAELVVGDYRVDDLCDDEPDIVRRRL